MSCRKRVVWHLASNARDLRTSNYQLTSVNRFDSLLSRFEIIILVCKNPPGSAWERGHPDRIGTSVAPVPLPNHAKPKKKRGPGISRPRIVSSLKNPITIIQ
jgi:hypothetical protein